MNLLKNTFHFFSLKIVIISVLISCSNPDSISVSCIRFESKNSDLKDYCKKMNEKTESELPCTHWSTTEINFGSKMNPDASEVWGFYRKLKKYKLFNGSLPEFLETYALINSGSEYLSNIITEIKSWKEHPMMNFEVRNEIDNAMKTNN